MRRAGGKVDVAGFTEVVVGLFSMECTVRSNSRIVEDRLSHCASLILVVVFRNVRRSCHLDICLRQDGIVFLGKGKGSDGHDSLSALQAVGDLNLAHIPDTYFYLLLMRLVI